MQSSSNFFDDVEELEFSIFERTSVRHDVLHQDRLDRLKSFCNFGKFITVAIDQIAVSLISIFSGVSKAEHFRISAADDSSNFRISGLENTRDIGNVVDEVEELAFSIFERTSVRHDVLHIDLHRVVFVDEYILAHLQKSVLFLMCSFDLYQILLSQA